MITVLICGGPLTGIIGPQIENTLTSTNVTFVENVDSRTCQVRVESAENDFNSYTYYVQNYFIKGDEEEYFFSLADKLDKLEQKYKNKHFNKTCAQKFNNFGKAFKPNKQNTRKMRCKNWAKLNHK